jgi:hypothetical protein
MSKAPNDYVEILNLIYRYPELIDAGDFEGSAGSSPTRPSCSTAVLR